MSWDLVSLGRSNVDLYAQDIGADFEDVTGFDAMAGGSPTNIAIGASRLGVRTTLLTAVGDDRTGGLVLRNLANESVDTSYVPRIEGKLTSLALLGVKPPNDFPLSFYRDDPADIYLDVETIRSFPFDQVGAAQISGNALSRGPCADAAQLAARTAKALGATTYMDVDLRPTEWDRADAYGSAIRSVLPHLDVLIGTEEEFHAALFPDEKTGLSHSAVPREARGRLEAAVTELLDEGPGAIVLKRGAYGASVITAGGTIDIAGFPVDVLNTVGAGDAFAAGLIRSRELGLDWQTAVRFANACGAIVVTRHGCSKAMPTVDEVEAFIASHAP